jgi:hypothetical protein
MNRRVSIAGMALLFLGAPLVLIGGDGPAGTPPVEAGETRVEAGEMPAPSVPPREPAPRREVYPISDGVLLVYTASDEAAIARVRCAAAAGCDATCCHGNLVGSGDVAPAGGLLPASSAARGMECVSSVPTRAGVRKEVVETPNGAIVLITAENRRDVLALHAWVRERNEGDPAAHRGERGPQGG